MHQKNFHNTHTISNQNLHHLHLIAFILMGLPHFGQGFVLTFFILSNNFIFIIITSGPPEPEKENNGGLPIILNFYFMTANKIILG